MTFGSNVIPRRFGADKPKQQQSKRDAKGYGKKPTGKKK